MPQNLAVRSTGEQPTFAGILGYGISTNTERKTGLLVFTKYEDGNCFLSEIWQPYNSTGFHTVRSKREQESITSRLVTGNRPQTVVVIAKLIK
jgi:hypothetical protein